MPRTSFETASLESSLSANPEEVVLGEDHRGVAVALALLPPKLRKVMCEVVGLNDANEPRTPEEAADILGISADMISTYFDTACRQLGATSCIREIIQGEELPPDRAVEASLRHIPGALRRVSEENLDPVDHMVRLAAQDACIKL